MNNKHSSKEIKKNHSNIDNISDKINDLVNENKRKSFDDIRHIKSNVVAKAGSLSNQLNLNENFNLPLQALGVNGYYSDESISSDDDYYNDKKIKTEKVNEINNIESNQEDDPLTSNFILCKNRIHNPSKVEARCKEYPGIFSIVNDGKTLYCNVCKNVLSAHKSDVSRHIISVKHNKNYEEYNGNSSNINNNPNNNNNNNLPVESKPLTIENVQHLLGQPGSIDIITNNNHKLVNNNNKYNLTINQSITYNIIDLIKSNPILNSLKIDDNHIQLNNKLYDQLTSYFNNSLNYCMKFLTVLLFDMKILSANVSIICIYSKYFNESLEYQIKLIYIYILDTYNSNLNNYITIYHNFITTYYSNIVYLQSNLIYNYIYNNVHSNIDIYNNYIHINNIYQPINQISNVFISNNIKIFMSNIINLLSNNVVLQIEYFNKTSRFFKYLNINIYNNYYMNEYIQMYNICKYVCSNIFIIIDIIVETSYHHTSNHLTNPLTSCKYDTVVKSIEFISLTNIINQFDVLVNYLYELETIVTWSDYFIQLLTQCNSKDQTINPIVITNQLNCLISNYNQLYNNLNISNLILKFHSNYLSVTTNDSNNQPTNRPSNNNKNITINLTKYINLLYNQIVQYINQFQLSYQIEIKCLYINQFLYPSYIHNCLTNNQLANKNNNLSINANTNISSIIQKFTEIYNHISSYINVDKNSVYSELLSYISLIDTLTIHSNDYITNLSKFWSRNKQLFPYLYKLVRYMLYIQVICFSNNLDNEIDNYLIDSNIDKNIDLIKYVKYC